MPLSADRFSTALDRYLLDGQLNQLAAPGLPMRPSIDRLDVQTDVAAALVTQVMTCVAVPLKAGDIVTRIAVKSGATAAGTPTNWWFALYSSAATPALLSQTADQLTAAWGANTTMDLPLAVAQPIAQSGIYYVAIMVKATTVPSLPCMVLPLAGVSSGLLTGQATIAQTSGAALTTTATATIAAPTASVNVPLVVCH